MIEKKTILLNNKVLSENKNIYKKKAASQSKIEEQMDKHNFHQIVFNCLIKVKLYKSVASQIYFLAKQ